MIEHKSLRIKWIGLTLIIGTIVSILTKRIHYVFRLRADILNPTYPSTYNRQIDTTTFTMFLLVNLIVTCLIFAFFYYKWRKESTDKYNKIGLIGSIVALVIQVVNIILFIVAELQIYYHKLPIREGIFITQSVFAILFTLSYIFILLCLWKVIYIITEESNLSKILSVVLLLFGLTTFLYAMEVIYLQVVISMIGRAIRFSYFFFWGLFVDFYEILAVATGTLIIFSLKREK